jgi:hypothetical protein
MATCIRVEAAERFGKRAGGRRIDGVAHRRAVDRDDRNGAVGLATDGRKIWHREMIMPPTVANK